MSQPGWANLLEDLRKMHRQLSYKLSHQFVRSMDQAVEQNFQRGQLWGLELLLEFEQEMKDWKESHREK